MLRMTSCGVKNQATLLALASMAIFASAAFSQDKPIVKPKSPQQFCEPQLQLAQTHLEKVTRERNGLSMRDTSLELQIQFLERQVADLKKKLEDVQKATDAGIEGAK